VLVVSQYFWPEVFRINAVVRTLVEGGSEVDVLTGKPNYPDGRIFSGYRAIGLQSEIWSGAKLLRIPLIPRGQRSSWQLALNYLSFIISGLLFGPWLLRGRKYDVVFVYGLSPILLAIPAVFLSWLKHCPMVLWVQDLWPESLSATGYVRSPILTGMVRRVVRWIYNRSDLILVQSRAFVASVAALAPGKTIVYYPNSVDPIFSEPPSATVALPEIEALDQGFPVVFAGNVGVGQAVEVIVEAASLLNSEPQIRIVVIGQGSRWDWMRQQVQERNLTNLHLPGRFPESTMPGLMQKASALLVTLADEPIFALTVPNKIQAYLAVGRPILASLNGEGARIVQEAGAGLSVPAQDPRALADAILQLYAMPKARRDEMGANGRRYYKACFDHDRLVAQLQGYLQDLTTHSGEKL
jgi:glycosyltransferase involved in cell wall biosynthesis